ncbi:PrgI family protein [Patescibacteria group bacterium]|nr:PrgI family protein [Patescibacteria group bacterium]MCL5010195.1 PrgI family protein [Patescibacteria group bacterium]
MENHPIPQDITSFQFKLIGDMTVKQFAYLAAGSIMAWIMFSIQILGVIKFPIAIFIFIAGFSMAFVPLEGRPMDTMIYLFLKALFVPNEYLFKKEGQIAILHISLNHVAKKRAPGSSSYEKLQSLLKNTTANIRPNNKLDEREMTFFESLSTFYFPKVPSQNYLNVALPKPERQKETKMEDLVPTDEAVIENDERILREQTETIKKELEAAKAKESLEKKTNNFPVVHQKVAELESRLEAALMEKGRLEKELALLSQRLNSQSQRVFAPGTFTLPKTQNVVSVPKSMSQTAGMPIVPEIPNILAGVVKDARGNILVNILIEVKDKDGNPVRAFKTNSLGQFSSATPLLNGIYTLEFEDPQGKQRFDKIELAAKGEIIPLLQISSTDERETLRKELFKT